MAVIRKYKKTETDLITTRCPFYECVIGGYYCVNCISFGAKDRLNGTVYCRNERGESKHALPPQREKKVTN